MFRGNHPTRVDEKGRLKVPSEFKHVLEQKYGSQFYITSLNGKVAKVYPLEEWEALEQRIAKISDFEESKQRFLDATNYFGQVVEIDGQGRLLLPSILREKADLKGEVAVTGKQTHLQVENKAAYEARLEQQPFTDEHGARLAALGF